MKLAALTLALSLLASAALASECIDECDDYAQRCHLWAWHEYRRAIAVVGWADAYVLFNRNRRACHTNSKVCRGYCPNEHPTGIIGTARLVGWVEKTPWRKAWSTSIDAVTALDVIRSPWRTSDFAWVLDEVQALPEPLPYNGAQGLWNVPLTLAAELPR